MHAFKPFLAGSAFLLFAFVIPEIGPADGKQGTGKLTVFGVDGNKIESPKFTTIEFDDGGPVLHGKDFKPTVKGKVVLFFARDGKSNVGTQVVYLPDGKETPVTVRIMPAGTFDEVEEKAQEAKKKGDAVAQQEAYEQAKVALARDEQEIGQTQKAVDAWARDNGIPTMTYAQADKQIKRAEGLGDNADKTNLDNLKSYRDKLRVIEQMKLTAADEQKRLAAIEPAKKVSALPGGAPAADGPGTVKVTVLGVDGKPVQAVVQEFDTYAPEDPGEAGVKGQVKIFLVNYDGNSGRTTVYVPDGAETQVIITLKSDVSFEKGAQKALKGKESGDAAMQQAGYDEAKEAVARAEQQVTEFQSAVEAWAKDNDVPLMTASEANKLIKASSTLGENQDPKRVARLKIYQSIRKDLESTQEAAAQWKARLAELSPPAKKVSGLPSACPEGQSGGLLAGLLNSATGTNSFTGICDDKEKQKDNDGGRGAAGRDHGDRGHGENED